MNFKDLYVTKNLNNIIEARRNILKKIDDKLDELNSYITGRTLENKDYSDVKTAKEHFDNLIEIRKIVNVNNNEFIELDFEEINVILKEERIVLCKENLFYYNYGGGYITECSISNAKISDAVINTSKIVMDDNGIKLNVISDINATPTNCII